MHKKISAILERLRLNANTNIEEEKFPADTKVVVFFGGSGRVGKLLLTDIPENVFVVNVSHRREVALPKVGNIKADLEHDDPKKILKKILRMTGRIDVLVFGAVAVSRRSLLAQTEEEMAREYKINVWSAVLFLKACMPYFISRGVTENQARGRAVITFSSIITRHGVHHKRLDLGPYAAQKSALEMSMRCLVHELGSSGIGSAILAPGQVVGDAYIQKVREIFWKDVLSGGREGCAVDFIEG